MCGRYVRKGDKQKISEAFRAEPNPAELPMPGADYDIAPTTYQPNIRESWDQARECGGLPAGDWRCFNEGAELHLGAVDYQWSSQDHHEGRDLAQTIQKRRWLIPAQPL